MNFLIRYFGRYPTLLRIWLPRAGPHVVAVSHIASRLKVESKDAKRMAKWHCWPAGAVETSLREKRVVRTPGIGQRKQETGAFYMTIAVSHKPLGSENTIGKSTAR